MGNTYARKVARSSLDSTIQNMSPISSRASAGSSYSAVNATGKPASKSSSLLRERRRTLQTINELSTSKLSLTSAEEAPPVPDIDLATRAGPKKQEKVDAAKRYRRRSLPNQRNGLGHEPIGHPSILVTPADAPPLRRAQTDPIHSNHSISQSPGHSLRRAGSGDPSRLSVEDSLRRKRSSQNALYPVAENGHVDPHVTSHSNYTTSAMLSKGKRAVQAINGDISSGRSKNERSTHIDRERQRAEQALAGARSRRRSEGCGIAIGSPPLFPFASPPPGIANGKGLDARRQSSQQHLVHNNRPGVRFSGVPERRSSHGDAEQRMAAHNNARFFKNARIRNYPQTHTHRGGMERRGSTASEPSFGPHIVPANSYMPRPALVMRPQPSRSLSSPGPNGQFLPTLGRPFSSLKTSPAPTRSSSMQSNVSFMSTKSHSSETSATSFASVAGTDSQPTQTNAGNGRLEVFPSLTNSTVQHKRYMQSQSIGPGASLHNVASTIEQGHASRSTDRLSEAPTLRSRSRSRSQTPNGSTHASSPASTIIYDENPDKRGLPVPEHIKEKQRLSKWKSTQKVEADRKAQKIKERVKRANELEEAKEEELKKGGWKRRSFFCGMFGK